MNPPTMAGWNLTLRFVLELAALAGLGAGAWKLSSGSFRWPTAILVPVVAAVAWSVFNVIADPSRSGGAPVEVDGLIRLGIELLVLGGGAAAVALAVHTDVGIVMAILIAAHYVASWSRIEWLVQA
jgi:hypothetical protein